MRKRLWREKFDGVDEVVLENKTKGDIKYEDLVQYTGSGDIGGGVWGGGVGE